jgi:hypothetical protein
VRARDNPDNCAVIGSWGGWLWLYQLDYYNVTPFTARADIYDLV